MGDKGKHGSKCVLSDSKWYTPQEFQKLGDKSARKWKMSLTHRGRPLSEYSLDCCATATDAVGFVSNTPSSAAAATQSTNIPSNSAIAAESSNTMLIDVPLAFIKAFRLRGDKVNLRSIVLERFDQAAIIEQSKQSLWEACKSDLDAGGLCFHQRRSSDRRAQIEADLDYVLAAFDLLDSKASSQYDALTRVALYTTYMHALRSVAIVCVRRVYNYARNSRASNSTHSRKWRARKKMYKWCSFNAIICDCVCINHPFSAKVEFSAGAKVVDTLPFYTYIPKSENPSNFRVESLNKKLKTYGWFRASNLRPRSSV